MVLGKSMTEWYLYFLERQIHPNKKLRFRNYEHFMDWLLESFND